MVQVISQVTQGESVLPPSSPLQHQWGCLGGSGESDGHSAFWAAVAL